MNRQRITLVIASVAVAALVVALILSDGVRDWAAQTALLTWLVIGGLIALGVWATRQLPPPTRSDHSPPGVQWFPLGLGWERRRDRD
ncbi:MAG: hypothetical protein O2798_07315 [Chloroflexi bacterium]|nr:hypothetical protein [Chloroflexota bacterium]